MAMHSEQKRILQLMTPEQKLLVALRLYHSARELKAAAFRELDPQLSEKEVMGKVREAFLYART